ncbi:MAG: hypothetical protein WAT39_19015 [Planctomycetota bacterium]
MTASHDPPPAAYTAAMRVSFRRCWLLPIVVACSQAVAQLPLVEVAKLARARAERSRPAQQKALEPYWVDLALDYRVNQQHLDTKIAEIAALGDSVVPLLLEKMQPSQGGETARNVAGNCRRVLEKLDPGSFVDALAEMANGSNDIARTEAIRLLGSAQVPAAVTLLADLLDRTTGENKRLVVRSLRLLRAGAAAPKIAPMLASNDRQVREDVLLYLLATKAAAVVDTVVQALGSERDEKLLPYYVDYFAAAVRGHDVAARALLPLLEPGRLDYQDCKHLVAALATIAPADHDPTSRKLHEILDRPDAASSLGVQAALSLKALGDNRGVSKLKRTFEELFRKPARKKEAALFEQRAALAFGTEDYGKAFDDYEAMLDNTDGPAMTRRAYIGLMKCEAHRKKITNLQNLMKSSGLAVDEIDRIGADDPVFAQTLQQDKMRAFLLQLAKDQAPK